MNSDAFKDIEKLETDLWGAGGSDGGRVFRAFAEGFIDEGSEVRVGVPDETVDFFGFLGQLFDYGFGHVVFQILVCRPDRHMYPTCTVLLNPAD